VKKAITVANFALIVLGTFFLVRSVQTWIYPEYLSRVDGTSLVGESKTVQKLQVFRKPYDGKTINSIVVQNLFRKERSESSTPVQVAKARPVAPKRTAPPPDLKLKGVILLGETKIALLEGSYSIPEANNSFKKKPLKRKGYFLGSQVGDYQLTRIEKASVKLDNQSGQSLELKLADRPPDKIIQRQGNALIQTNKNFNPKEELKAVPPSRKRAPNPKKQNKEVQKSPFRVSGAATPPTPETPHISGK
jgi:hypothetical protein